MHVKKQDSQAQISNNNVMLNSVRHIGKQVAVVLCLL